MWTLLKIAAAVLGLYVVVTLAAYFGQRRLLYHPDPNRIAPANAGLADVREQVLAMPDGARVVAWYGKAQPGKKTLLYFHGNAGGLAERADRIRRFMSEGWGVYIMAYRGYAGSTGSPTETRNISDARLAYGALVLEGVPADSIVIYGESLGTGVAARMAAERRAAGLILESPYTSILELARSQYWYLPVQWLLADRYETDKVIGQVRVPVLILHGQKDSLIPVAMAQRLFVLANEPKKLVVLPNGWHSNLYVESNDALPAVRDWIGGLDARASATKE